jgi:hypothetical protein
MKIEKKENTTVAQKRIKYNREEGKHRAKRKKIHAYSKTY